ncbi:MAG: 50S ribosomal protein L29 [Chitinivibrionales bacterium]|nr:50S ribosomal protein L29 [Chitinivibrionales bacterium]
MKAAELRELTVPEIREKIEGYEEEMFNLRFQARMGQLSNPLQVRILRRETARAKGVLQEKLREAAAAQKAEA